MPTEVKMGQMIHRIADEKGITIESSSSYLKNTDGYAFTFFSGKEGSPSFIRLWHCFNSVEVENEDVSIPQIIKSDHNQDDLELRLTVAIDKLVNRVNNKTKGKE